VLAREIEDAVLTSSFRALTMKTTVRDCHRVELIIYSISKLLDALVLVNGSPSMCPRRLTECMNQIHVLDIDGDANVSDNSEFERDREFLNKIF